jgi:hypothetical protein
MKIFTDGINFELGKSSFRKEEERDAVRVEPGEEGDGPRIQPEFWALGGEDESDRVLYFQIRPYTVLAFLVDEKYLGKAFHEIFFVNFLRVDYCHDFFESQNEEEWGGKVGSCGRPIRGQSPAQKVLFLRLCDNQVVSV